MITNEQFEAWKSRNKTAVDYVEFFDDSACCVSASSYAHTTLRLRAEVDVLRAEVERLQLIVDRAVMVFLAVEPDDPCRWFAETLDWNSTEWRVVKRNDEEGDIVAVLRDNEAVDHDVWSMYDQGTEFPTLADAITAFNDWRKQCQQEK